MVKENLILVLDTNILLSVMLKDGFVRKLILNENLNLICPQSLAQEIKDNSEELSKRVNITKEGFCALFELLFKSANVKEYPLVAYVHLEILAKSICPQGHEDDWPFLDLAICENVSFWSNDKALTNQKIVPILSTKEVAQFVNLQ